MWSMRTSEFRDLHQSWLTLPCAWDALSAAVFGHAGHKAIGTTSAGVAWSLGLPDGGLTRDDAVAAARRIVGATDCLVSVDVENGYSSDPTAVAGLLVELADIGAVGVNIEDQGPEGQRSTGEFADWLGRVLGAHGRNATCSSTSASTHGSPADPDSRPTLTSSPRHRLLRGWSRRHLHPGCSKSRRRCPRRGSDIVARQHHGKSRGTPRAMERRRSTTPQQRNGDHAGDLLTAARNGRKDGDDDALDLDFATIQGWFA